MLRRFLEKCPPTGGVLGVGGPFLDYTRPLQDVAGQGVARFPVAVLPSGPVDWDRVAALPLVEVDPESRPQAVPVDHPAFAEAAKQPVPVTDCMVHTLDHWSHLLRVNLLALVAYVEGERKRFDRSFFLVQGVRILAMVLKARSANPYRVAAALSLRGRNCDIHPTAVVEACRLGDNVQIGPYAVVRGSWLCDGAKVNEHARVNLSVVGPGATVGRDAMVNVSVLMEGALVSAGFGYQACVFGRESFIAMGATAFDLSFGGEIKVRHRGERVPSGTHFLGVAYGHRCKIGPHVAIGYGEEVPYDAFLVADPATVARRIPEQIEGGVPHTVVNGRVIRVERSGA
jgi:carbonic anhydrase/acetyltransferase-like protein (isoleucine patch superfamily)